MMSRLFWHRSWLFALLMAFVLQGAVVAHAASSSPGQKQSVSHAGHVHSHSAAIVDAELARFVEGAALSGMGDATAMPAGPEPECHTGGPRCPACVAVAMDEGAYVLPVRSSTHFPELIFHHRSPTLDGLDRPPQIRV
jgi:hypothetical protein